LTIFLNKNSGETAEAEINDERLAVLAIAYHNLGV